jgi:hypothetical protein
VVSVPSVGALSDAELKRCTNMSTVSLESIDNDMGNMARIVERIEFSAKEII